MARLSPDIEDQITRALASAREYDDDEVASSARYGVADDLLLLVLKSGRRVALPVEDLQGLADADRSLVAKVELDPKWGSYLHWEELDVDFSVAGLAHGLTGSERWMAALPERRRAKTMMPFLKTA